MKFRAQGFGRGLQRVWGLGLQGSGFRVQTLGSGLSVRALRVRVWPVDSGFRNNIV